MNNQMNNDMKGFASAKSLLLILVLLISACDGGIFGTGGPDDMLDPNMDSASAPITGVASENDNTELVGDSETDLGIENGSATDEANSTAGSGNNAASVDTDGGSTSGTGSDMDSTTAAEQSGDAGTAASIGRDNQFTNTIATLDNPAAQVNLFNTSSLSVNVTETGADTAPVLFDNSGIGTNTLSGPVSLQLNESSLAIVDNSAPAETLVGYSTFNAASSTLSTLIVRESESGVDAIALITETQTSDSSLAKVRVVQANTLGDATLAALFELQSAGTNPGGIDQSFGPLSFEIPTSDYTEIPTGDYELIDSAGRFDNQMLSFVGNNVYTIILLGNSSNPVVLINDTEAAER